MKFKIFLSFLCFSSFSLFAREFCFSNPLSCRLYQCIEEDMKCGEEAYLLSYGSRYCQKFQDDFKNNLAILSIETQMWRMETSLCLQKDLYSSWKDGDQCELMEERAFNIHPLCYTNHKNSFCTLPAKDIAFILGKVINPKELLLDKKMRKQIYETAKICLNRKKEERSDYDFEALAKRLKD